MTKIPPLRVKGKEERRYYLYFLVVIQKGIEKERSDPKAAKRPFNVAVGP